MGNSGILNTNFRKMSFITFLFHILYYHVHIYILLYAVRIDSAKLLTKFDVELAINFMLSIN